MFVAIRHRNTGLVLVVMTYRNALLTNLDFVRSIDGRLDVWHVKEGLDWEESCSVGKSRARQFITFSTHHQDPTLLSRITRQIVSKGVWGPVEMSFFHGIGVHVI